MVNKSTQIAHSLTQSGVQGVPPMPLHPQVLKPCTLNETKSTTPVYIKVVNTSCHLSKCTIIMDKWFNIIKVQITCEQVSSKNKFS